MMLRDFDLSHIQDYFRIQRQVSINNRAVNQSSDTISNEKWRNCKLEWRIDD